MWTAKEYALLIDTLGVPAKLHYTKLPADVVSLAKIGFATVSKQDDAIINAYGVGARIITIKASDVTRAPIKFDRIEVGSEFYTIDTVTNVHLPGTGTVVGYRCFAKGHNQ